MMYNFASTVGGGAMMLPYSVEYAPTHAAVPVTLTPRRTAVPPIPPSISNDVRIAPAIAAHRGLGDMDPPRKIASA